MNSRTASLLSTIALLTAAATAQSQRFSPLGAGCAGSNGVPTLSAANVPTLGQVFLLRLDQAPPLAPVLLYAGFSDQTSTLGPLPIDLAMIGGPGCVWRNSAELQLGLSLCDASGHVNNPLAIPAGASWLGVEFFPQYLVIDRPANALGATVSNAARATIGQFVPMVIGGVSSPIVGLGQSIQITAQNVDANPDNTCWRIMFPDGDTALLRARSVSQGPAGQIVTADLASLPQPHNLGRQGMLGAFRGNGGQPLVTGSSAALSAPGQTWGWRGEDVWDFRVMTPIQITVPAPVSGQRHYARYQMGATDTAVVVGSFPATPLCPTGAFYRQGWTFLTDIHFDIRCPDGVRRHFDFFMQAVTVVPVGGLSRTQALASHSAQIQDQLDAQYGANVFLVLANYGANTITIEPVDPACVIQHAGGKTIITWSCQ